MCTTNVGVIVRGGEENEDCRAAMDWESDWVGRSYVHEGCRRQWGVSVL